MQQVTREPAGRFGELRSLTHADRPTEQQWELLCAMIERWPEPSRSEVAIPYCLDQLARWPQQLRKPSPLMRDALIRGEPSPALALCERLQLGFDYFRPGQRLTNAALTSLVQSRFAAHITHLQLSSQPLGDGALRAIACSPFMASLQSLRLDFTCVTSAGVKALATSHTLTHLSHVVLSNLDLGDEVGEVFQGWSARSRLRTLDLSSNALTDRAASKLASSPALAALRELDLRFNTVTDEGAFALASSPHLGSVEKLAVDYNAIGMAGWRALVHSPNFWRAEVSCYPTR